MLVPQNPVTDSMVVLVADDEPIVLLTVQTVLTRAGYTILTAHDGAKGLEVSRSHPGPIHLLLVDVAMPNLTGPQLAKVVAVERPGIRILLMTGHSSSRIPAESLSLLRKPFRSTELVIRVRQELAGLAAHQG